MPEVDRPMTDEEYVTRLGKIYQHILSLRKDSDYVINQPQMDKLIELLNYFLAKAKALDGEVQKVNLKPAEINGGITAHFLVFDTHGEDVQRFCKVLSYCSSIGIDALESGDVCIDCTVPQVFVPKS